MQLKRKMGFRTNTDEIVRVWKIRTKMKRS